MKKFFFDSNGSKSAVIANKVGCLFFILLSLFFSGNVNSATCISTGSGNWAVNGSWSCGSLPTKSANELMKIVLRSSLGQVVNDSYYYTGEGNSVLEFSPQNQLVPAIYNCSLYCNGKEYNIQCADKINPALLHLQFPSLFLAPVQTAGQSICRFFCNIYFIRIFVGLRI